jgi:hypothetical protein
MRLPLFLSLVFFACAVPAPSQEVFDRERRSFKGPVKSVRTKSADPEISHEITFDREGRKVGEAYYEPDDKLFRRRVFTYDAGRSTEESYGPDGKLLDRVVSKEEFDKARGTGRTTFTVELDGKSVLRTEIVNKYDSLGRPVESSSYDREGKLQSRSVWKFSADGGLEEFILYNGAGSVLQRYVRIPEGMRIFVYGNDGALVSTETRGRQVCTESDQYGNCKRGTTARSINKDGKVEEVTATTYRTFTYY